MTEVKRIGDLEIDEDIDFQRKEWHVERWGWVLMLIIALAGLLGAFGNGLLSSAAVQSGPVKVQYGRFERLLAPAQISVRLDQRVVQNGEARLRVDQSLLEYYTVQRIIPSPDSEEVAADHVTFVFKIPKAGKPFRITFNMESNRLGFAQGQVGIENGPTLRLSQFIYP
jgi:hypothetical protein